MQTHCALSTMESKHLALSQTMKNLIPLCKILKESTDIVLNKEQTVPQCTANSKSFSDIISDESESHKRKSKVSEDNHACLKFAGLPHLTPRTKHITVSYH